MVISRFRILLVGMSNIETKLFELYLAQPDAVVAPTKNMIAIGRRKDWAELMRRRYFII